MELFGVASEVHWKVTDLSELSDSFVELISRARKLRLEEGKPEQLGVLACSEMLDHFALQVVVHNVLHVDGVEIVGPRVEDLEALVLDSLVSVSFNVVVEELEGGLVGLDWIVQVVLVVALLGVPQELTDGLDARC